MAVSDAAHAARAITNKDLGAPLPSDLSSRFGSAYGVPLGDVRVHTDGNAATAASQTSARAFAYGSDIFFGSGQYNPGTREGNQLIGHELAHVAQQSGLPQGKGTDGDSRLAVGQAGDAQEKEADRAADLALAGGKPSLSKAGPALRFDKQGAMGRGGHAQSTEEALMEGAVQLSAEEAHRARMLNWMQDYNQVFQPLSQTYHLVAPLKPIMEILAIKEFGIGIDWDKMGTYDPVRHIDRPDQLKGDGAFAQGPIRFDGLNDDSASNKNPNAGGDDQPYHDLDSRYRNLPGYGDKDKDYNVNSDGKNDDAAAYKVNASGVPAFVAASKEQTKGEFMESARRGTKGARKKDWDPEAKTLNGPELFAVAAHTLQDYPTHCNFVEVALNILIREGKGGLEVASGPGKDDKTRVGATETIDTGIHQFHEKGTENNHVKNYTIKVPKKKDGKEVPGETEEREVITSGGFSTIDTIESLVSGLKDTVDGLDPMSDEQPALTNAILDYIDKRGGTAGDFSNLGGIVKNTARVLNALGTLAPRMGSGLIKGAGVLAEGAGNVAAIPSDIASGGLSLLGDAARAVGADSVASVADAASGVAAVPGDAARAVGGAAKGVAFDIGGAIDKVVQKMDAMVAAINDQHSLVRLKDWMKEKMDALVDSMIAAVGLIPFVGDKAKSFLEEMRKQLKSAIKQLITLAWLKVKADTLATIAAASKGLADWRAAKDKAAAEQAQAPNGKKDPSRSKNLTDPGHSNISKDHADYWIEEDGEDAEGKKFKVRETEKLVLDPKTGEYREAKKLEESSWLNDWAKKNGYDTTLPKEEKKEYKPENMMQALSPLAHGIGAKMTKHVKAAVEQGWLRADVGQPVTDGPVSDAVDYVWNHPADNRELWEGMASSFLSNPMFGPAFIRQLRGTKG